MRAALTVDWKVLSLKETVLYQKIGGIQTTQDSYRRTWMGKGKRDSKVWSLFIPLT